MAHISLPQKFNVDGVLPPKDYNLTITELKKSMLILGPSNKTINWDSSWREKLANNLEIMVTQLWQIGITEIFIDGSFTEDKDHPNDIDGYFECNARDFASGNIERDLNKIDPYKVWTWNHASRKPYWGYPKKQLPMWHVYRIELYPHYEGVFSGIRDKFGNNMEFPSAFRVSRKNDIQKGIIRIIK